MNNFKSITTSILFGSVYLIISRFTEKINSNFFDPSGDSNSYLSLAQSIKENGEFVRYEFIQNGFETIRTPLYPLLLSINNLDNLKPFIFVQFLLHCFTALLVFKILIQKTNTKIAYFFSFLFLFNPVLFAQSQLVLTETLSIFLMGLCVFLLFEKKGLIFSGLSPDSKLPEIVELKNHPWFIGVQFHPEFKSRPLAPHPLFSSFIKAAKTKSNK